MNELEELDTLLRKDSAPNAGGWSVFVYWGGWKARDEMVPEDPPFHLTRGMCDDFGCSESCRNFGTLKELLAYLREKHTGGP